MDEDAQAQRITCEKQQEAVYFQKPIAVEEDKEQEQEQEVGG